jgi:hypothetical protein
MRLRNRIGLGWEWLALHKSIWKSKRRLIRLMKDGSWSRRDCWSAAQLYEHIAASRSGNVCHVIASGQSLLQSMDVVRPGVDYVIGFNFAALAPLAFDLYFCEIASERTDLMALVSSAQRALVGEHARKRIRQVVFKNLWEGKVDRNYLLRNYESRTPLLYDILLPSHALSSGGVCNPLSLASLLARDRCFVRQVYTTTLTAVVVAAHCKFEKIVIHGWDFSGPHFYADSAIEWPGCISSEARALLLRGSPKHAEPHATAEASIMVPAFADLLRARGVEVFAASKLSPLSDLLPVFRAERN